MRALFAAVKNLAVAAVIIVGGMVGAGSSNATTCVGTTCLVGSPSDASGIDGLVVPGLGTFNVTFENIPYFNVFGCGSGGNPPTCTNPPTFNLYPTYVSGAATALAAALNSLHVTGITGITGQDEQNVLIPFGWITYYDAADNAKVAYCLSSYIYCFNSNAIGSWVFVGSEYDVSGNTNPLGGQNDWAVFRATPLPAAFPLFATGLGGLGLLGWRRSRKAQTAAALIPRAGDNSTSEDQMPYRPNLLCMLFLALMALFGFKVPAANATTFDLTIDCATCASLFPTLPTAIDLTTSSASSPYLITGISEGTLLPPGTYAPFFGTPPGNDNLLSFPSSHLFDEQGLSFEIGSDAFNLFSVPLGASYVYGGQYALATFTATATTPLPVALPLFGTGLGALGLLSWRRRRKATDTQIAAQAVAA